MEQRWAARLEDYAFHQNVNGSPALGTSHFYGHISGLMKLQKFSGNAF
jgi:hypothetical protein